MNISFCFPVDDADTTDGGDDEDDEDGNDSDGMFAEFFINESDLSDESA